MKTARILSILSLALASTASSAAAAPASAEVKPAEALPCFPGAYYRKAVSSVDHWQGIEAVVKLPNPVYDETRLKPTGRPLDNASLYLGGRAGEQEIDCGVTWEVIKQPDGTTSKVGKAFRPFWRNNAWNSAPANPDYYYYPGDIIRMKVDNSQDGKLVMRIDLLARAGTPEANCAIPTSTEETTAIQASASIRPQQPLSTPILPADSLTSFTTVFDAQAFRRDALKEFKRVNGLDQSGNEGKAVQPTNTHIDDAVWLEAWLLRDHKRLPMTPDRYTDMRCPDAKHIAVTPVGVSGEKVTLMGNPQKHD